MSSLPPLAIDGGLPVRRQLLPYGRQSVDEDDIQAVVAVLRGEWLTTGPRVEEFERAFAAKVGAGHAVAVSSGTAALHAAMYGLGVGPGDEVIVPAITFAATANCVVYQGARPVFADVAAGTLLIDPASVEAKLSPRTKAVIAVDYAGQPCDYDRLRALLAPSGVPLVADACHALGGTYRGRPVGGLADLSAFSFHPVKHITSGEGGMVTTEDGELARRMRVFRNHGILTDHRQRAEQGSWAYEMVDLGYNYRLTDFQCALGLSQLGKLDEWVGRRRAVASAYQKVLPDDGAFRPLAVAPDVGHAYHLFVVRVAGPLEGRRDGVFRALRAEGIGVNVHYLPVHLHPFYRDRFGTAPGQCPCAEAAYDGLLSLPMFATMSDGDVADVVLALEKVGTMAGGALGA